MTMLANYLKVALRNLRKNPLFAFLNVAGLAVGLACCTFIVLYVIDELGYERFHDNADRIVRFVEDTETEGGDLLRRATTYGPLALALRQDVPAVEQAVRVIPFSLLTLRGDDQKFQEDGFLFVDSTFFEVFTFPLLRGDPATALDAPFSVVLTEAMARKYFGDADPIGQTLAVRDDEKPYSFTVTGVVAEPPPNTHLRFDFLGSFASMRTFHGTWIEDPRNWEHPPLYTYALLADGAEPAAVAAQLPALARKHMGEDRTETRSLALERLTDIRLRSGRTDDLVAGSDVVYVYLFGLIAFFILLLACINFMNLATARAAGRAREVGMRKTLGAYRRQLVRQFLGESMLLVALALVLVVMLVEALLPLFNALSGKALASGVMVHWAVPLLLVATVVFVGLLAGIYPAFVLTRFRPAEVLKGGPAKGRPAAARLRQGLVVFQFAVSIVLLIGTAVVFGQLDYVQSERLGFDKERVVLVPLRDLDAQLNPEPIKQAWQQLPGVEHVTISSGMPGLGGGIHDFALFPEGAVDDSLQMMTLTVDHDYAETYGLEIVAGRDFSEDFSTDASAAFLLNESAARRLGWTDNAVGKTLTLQVYFHGEVRKTGTVVGVVRDFQYHSLHRAIDPTVLHIFPKTYYYDYLSVRLAPGNMAATLAGLEQAWARLNPERPFEYTFLDDQFEALYRAEARLGGLFGIFAGLAVLVACLGLFGLAAFTAQQRTKEIGIRKVMGAGVAHLVLLLSKDFVRLVAVAFVVAAPVAYLGMSRWLDAFAYRIALGPDVFALAGALVLAVALLTVSYQSVRAALADPVQSLRYE